MHFLLNLEWGDWATWTTGILTAFALLFAFYQFLIERRLARAADIISQAEHISSWVDDESGDRTRVAVLNESKSPVYKVIVKLVRAGHDITTNIDMELLRYVSFISVLPPGKYVTYIDKGYRGMSFTPAIEISFTDSRGRHWIRGGNGNILALNQSPVDYYGIGEPMPWHLPGERQFM